MFVGRVRWWRWFVTAGGGVGVVVVVVGAVGVGVSGGSGSGGVVVGGMSVMGFV